MLYCAKNKARRGTPGTSCTVCRVAMSDLNIPARKFLRLLDYLQRLGIDIEAVAGAANLSLARITQLSDDVELPARQYSRLYKEAVVRIEQLGQPIPWAAGVGSEPFELMCHCMIGADTLGAALELAGRFERLAYPLLGHKMRLLREGPTAVIRYEINLSESSGLVPEQWDRADYQETVAKASGLLVWHALCGWLTGRAIQISAAKISAPYLNDDYLASLQSVMRADIEFDAAETSIEFDARQLDRRTVHNGESLREFLGNAVFELISIEREPASTSAAIRSLIARDLPARLPSFSTISEYLHMSESSLRRRLLRENTSYQSLKDEVRCQIAIDKLLNEDARVAELAEYLGFTEPSSFIRSFKSWTGETPTAYREKVQALSA